MQRGAVSVEVEGLSSLLRDLKAAEVDINDLKDVFQRISDRATEVMKAAMPVKSGAMRAATRGNRAQSKAVVRVGTARVPYAGPIQWGWPKRNIAPAGFFEKTDAVMSPVALEMLEDGISDVLRKRDLT